MAKVKVVIVHGVGKAVTGYAGPLMQGITRAFDRQLKNILNSSRSYVNELEFSEVVWDDILGENQAKLAKIFDQEFRRRKLKTFAELAWQGGVLLLITLSFFFIFKKPAVFLLLFAALSYYGPKVMRKLRTNFVVEFIGDVIGYSAPAAYQKIHQRLLEGIGTLAQDGEAAEVSFVAHSLGTVICSNLAYDRQKAEGRLHPSLSLANFFTMGSPLALFSLKSGPEVFSSPIRLESEFGRWINVFDKDDPIAYPLKPLNEAYGQAVLRDQEVNTGIFGVAHLNYWNSKAVFKVVARKLALDWLRSNNNLSPAECEQLYKNYDRET